MTSRLLALVLAVALSCGVFAPLAPAFAAGSDSQSAQWNSWIAAQIKQSWINMYAAEKNLDPATVKWEDLPADLRARYEQTFGASASNARQ